MLGIRMFGLRNFLSQRPALARVVPFAVFLLLTVLQGQFGEEARYWIYFLKTLVGLWLLWVVWPLVSEMRWAFSWEAVVVGVAVFGLWVGLDGLYPSLNELLSKVGWGSSSEAAKAWNPHEQFGAGSGMALLFVIVRIVGSTLIVPPLEEAF
ncbi:MAG: hypothetical protein ACK4UN_02540, partial [Limisphaerales bacterium]